MASVGIIVTIRQTPEFRFILMLARITKRLRLNRINRLLLELIFVKTRDGIKLKKGLMSPKPSIIIEVTK